MSFSADLTLEVGASAPSFARAYLRLGDLYDGFDRATLKGVEKLTRIMEVESLSNINVKTGRTRATIRSEVQKIPGGARGWVGTDDEVARILEYGTRAHIIEAKGAKALRFISNGREYFAQNVFHPGTPEYAWMLRAGLSTATVAEEVLVGEYEDVMRRMA